MKPEYDQTGKHIAELAGTLAEGVQEAALKERLWTIARNALGIDGSSACPDEALHLVKTELCTLCKEQNLINCNGLNEEACDLVHIVVSKQAL